MSKEPEFGEFKIPGHDVTVPIMMLHGKQYLQVAQRLVWFNLEKQDWTIETELEKEWNIEGLLLARFKCVIKDPAGKIMRVARKTKAIESEKDYESCETGAIGRALSFLGYGTAYDKDMDEGDVVDAPQPPLKPNREAATKRVEKTIAIAKKAEQSSLEAAKIHLNPLHPFRDSVAPNSMFTGKTFEQIFMVDQATGFKWTKARHSELMKGIEKDQWVTDYLVYANDCGLHLT